MFGYFNIIRKYSENDQIKLYECLVFIKKLNKLTTPVNLFLFMLKPIPENFDDICKQKLTFMNKLVIIE